MEPLIIPPDFVARTCDFVRRCCDDIPECARASVTVEWVGANPSVKFRFAQQVAGGHPTFSVPLIDGGRRINSEELYRSVRSNVEKYLHADGIRITTKGA